MGKSNLASPKIQKPLIQKHLDHCPEALVGPPLGVGQRYCLNEFGKITRRLCGPRKHVKVPPGAR